MRRIGALAFACSALASGCGSRPEAIVKIERSPIEKASAKLTKDFAIPVLMYHRVSPLTAAEAKSPLTRDLTVLPEDFEAQVKHLKDSGYELLSVYDIQHALLNEEPLPEKSVAITLDDGYRDNFEHAFPILQKYDASATIFLVKNTIGSPRHLTWPMLREMRPNGIRYGSHTVSHADLPSCDDAQLDLELNESKRFLEKGLGESITSLPTLRADSTAELSTTCGSPAI